MVQGPANATSTLFRLAGERGIVAVQADPNQPVFLYGFTRDGVFRDTLALSPGATFETGPVEVGAEVCVSLLIGMPWNLGNGATLEIAVETDGELLVTQHRLDPAHHREDRTWRPVRIDLDPGTERASMSLTMIPDLDGQIGDWLGIAPGSEAGCLFSD